MDQNRARKQIVVKGPSAALPFSAAVACDRLIFISGTVGRDPQGGIARGDIAAQTAQTLENIRRHLEQAGSSLEQVLKVTVFLTDMGLFQGMNEAYRRFFPSEPPARSCVQVVSLPDREALIEIEAIAVR